MIQSVFTRNRYIALAAALVAVLILGAAASVRRQPAARAAAGVSITYAAGWNLVGGPDGTVFNAGGTLYTIGAGDPNYVSAPGNGPITGGKGYWAFFPAATSATLNGAGLSSVRVPVPAGQYIMVGNPSGTQSALVGGDADQVLTYDATSGRYNLTTTLGIGQGAWVLSYNGGTVTLTATGPVQTIPTDNGTSAGLPTPAAAPTGTATPAPSGGNTGTCTSGPLCQVLAITAGIDSLRTTYTTGTGGRVALAVSVYSFGRGLDGADLTATVSGANVPSAGFRCSGCSAQSILPISLPAGIPIGTTIYFHVVASYQGATASADATYKVSN